MIVTVKEQTKDKTQHTGEGALIYYYVVIIKQAFKYHTLNTDLEPMKIATLISGYH